MTNQNGNIITITNSTVIEVASGIHYLSSGRWKESRDLIRLADRGRAAALEGPCAAFFEQNLNTAGAHVFYATCQHGLVQANVPLFNNHDIWEGGDSGSPDMLPTGVLVMISGRMTSQMVPQMQTTMNTLCARQMPPLPTYSLVWAY